MKTTLRLALLFSIFHLPFSIALGDVKITALPAATSVQSTDIVPFVSSPSSSPETEKITWGNVFNSALPINGVTITVAGTAQFNLTNGSVLSIAGNVGLSALGSSGKVLGFDTSLSFTGTDNTTFTLPVANDTLAGLAATQTLTNKTISGTSNTITNVPAASVNYSSSGSGSVTRALNTKVSDYLHTPQDFGGIGDGSTHPLSVRFGSLAAAQSAFSFVVVGATTTNTSTTVACSNTTPLQVGYPVSGTGVPSGATIASITDGTHFVISAAATASGSPAITTSFVTSLTQEQDWAGIQFCLCTFGGVYLPPGNYLRGSSTLRTVASGLLGGESSLSDGITILGAGTDVVMIQGSGDAIHVLGRYQHFRGFSLAGDASPATPTFSTSSGITLGEGNYDNQFHADHLLVRNFNVGFNNVNGWDGSSLEECYFTDSFCNIFTSGNQDYLKVFNTTTGNDVLAFSLAGCTTTNSSTTVACTSTTGVFPGATISGTNIPAGDEVISITDATHFVIGTAATGSAGSLTVSVATIGARCDGTGSIAIDGGVSGGNGVSEAFTGGGTGKTSNMHLEGAQSIYVTTQNNAAIQFENCDFADGSGTATDIDLNTGGRLVVTGSIAFTGLTGLAGKVFVNAHGTYDARSPDHCAIANYNGVRPYELGDYYAQTGDNGFPTPTNGQAGDRLLLLRYSGWAHPDRFYTWLANAAGTLAWVPDPSIRTGTTGAMTAGAVTVTDAACTTSTIYTFAAHALGTVILPSAFYVSSRTAGTGFTITASQATDTSTVDWIAVEP